MQFNPLLFLRGGGVNRRRHAISTVRISKRLMWSMASCWDQRPLRIWPWQLLLIPLPRRQGTRLDVCEPTVPTGSSIDTSFSSFAGSIHHSMIVWVYCWVDVWLSGTVWPCCWDGNCTGVVAFCSGRRPKGTIFSVAARITIIRDNWRLRSIHLRCKLDLL